MGWEVLLANENVGSGISHHTKFSSVTQGTGMKRNRFHTCSVSTGTLGKGKGLAPISTRKNGCVVS